MPVVLIPPAGGTAELFFRLFLDLPSKGIRLIAVQAPPFTDHDDWIAAFHNFLDHINLKRVLIILSCIMDNIIYIYIDTSYWCWTWRVLSSSLCKNAS